MDFNLLGDLSHEAKLEIFKYFDNEQYERIENLFTPFQFHHEFLLKKPNFSHFSTHENAMENNYIYIPIEKFETEKRLQQGLSVLFRFYNTFFKEKNKHEAQNILIERLMNRGTVGEFKMKSDHSNKIVHKTFIVIKFIAIVIEHGPDEFLSRECKNTIKQNFAYALEHKTELLEEQRKRNLELIEMARNDPLILKEISNDTIAFFYQMKQKEVLQKTEKSLLDILNTSKKDEAARSRQLLIQQRNQEAVIQQQENSLKNHLQTTYTVALERGLPKRAKRSNARAKIYRTIRKKLVTIQAALALFKNTKITKSIERVLEIKMSDMALNCVGTNEIPTNYTKMSNGLSMFFISEQVKRAEQEKLLQEEKLQIELSHKKTLLELVNHTNLCVSSQTTIGMPSYDQIQEQQLKEKRNKTLTNFLKTYMRDQARMRICKFNEQPNKQVQNDLPKDHASSDVNDVVSEVFSDLTKVRFNHAGVTCNTGMTQWYGFNLNERLYTAMEVLQISKHVIYLPYNLDTASVIEEAIGKLSIFFKSKNYVYFSNNIKKSENILSEKQIDCIVNFFKDSKKAIKWFHTFCRNFNKVEILKQSINFSLSMDNNFHKVIFKFLNKYKNFEML
jgi:hypothetical protein